MDNVDIHVGKRLRRRRRLLGLTQEDLGRAIGTRFQQVQKYECGANRVTVSRLYRLALALQVPATYFFEGLPEPEPPKPTKAEEISNDVLNQAETIDLIRAYYKLGKRPRQKLLDLAKALRDDTLTAA
jgi:transcriptional regulator with XRE-family HTH domain